jgi:competence protein ComEC
MHVVAASGMNVTLLAGFLMSIFGVFFHRKVALLLGMSGVVVYAILSGLDPSIVRAAIMAQLAFGAVLFGRQYNGIYGLALTAGAMVLWSPLLIEDIGFQLSVLATLGIIVLNPLFTRYVKNFASLNFVIVEDLITTFSAQVFTLPILLLAFGQYGLLSILVNMLVLWTIPLITIVGGIGVLVGLLVAPLGQAIVYVCLPLLWYFVKVTSFFAGISPVLTFSQLPFSLLLGYYLLLAAGIISFSRK